MKYLTFKISVVLLTVALLLSSCEKDEIDEYYVKYEVSSSTIYYGGKLNVLLNAEDDEEMNLTINQREQWEITIGPVQKGFNSSIRVEAASETHDKLKLYSKIYVSKNDSPFALKEINGSDEPRNVVELNYKIDY